MKEPFNPCQSQRGVVLVTSLLFLLVVTIISVIAANNSTLGLRMSSNMQDAYRSFQEAEAGAFAALGLAGTANEPFDRRDAVTEPFQGMASHPLRNLADDIADVPVDVAVYLIDIDRECRRPPSGRGGTSVGVLDCDYYRIRSEHDAPGRARTKVELGVIKTVIGSDG